MEINHFRLLPNLFEMIDMILQYLKIQLFYERTFDLNNRREMQSQYVRFIYNIRFSTVTKASPGNFRSNFIDILL